MFRFNDNVFLNQMINNALIIASGLGLFFVFCRGSFALFCDYVIEPERAIRHRLLELRCERLTDQNRELLDLNRDMSAQRQENALVCARLRGRNAALTEINAHLRQENQRERERFSRIERTQRFFVGGYAELSSYFVQQAINQATPAPTNAETANAPSGSDTNNENSTPRSSTNSATPLTSDVEQVNRRARG